MSLSLINCLLMKSPEAPQSSKESILMELWVLWRRWWWCRWWNSCLIEEMNAVGKVLRFKHLVERFGLSSNELELDSDIIMSGHDCRREDTDDFGFGSRIG